MWASHSGLQSLAWVALPIVSPMWAYREYNDRAPSPPGKKEDTPAPPARPSPPKFSWRSIVGASNPTKPDGEISKPAWANLKQSLSRVRKPAGKPGGETSSPVPEPLSPGGRSEAADEIAELLSELLEDRRRRKASGAVGGLYNTAIGLEDFDEDDSDADTDDNGGEISVRPASISSKLRPSKASHPSKQSAPNDFDMDAPTDYLAMMGGNSTSTTAPHGAIRPPYCKSGTWFPSRNAVDPREVARRKQPKSAATHTPQPYDWPTREDIDKSLGVRAQAGDPMGLQKSSPASARSLRTRTAKVRDEDEIEHLMSLLPTVPSHEPAEDQARNPSPSPPARRRTGRTSDVRARQPPPARADTPPAVQGNPQAHTQARETVAGASQAQGQILWSSVVQVLTNTLGKCRLVCICAGLTGGMPDRYGEAEAYTVPLYRERHECQKLGRVATG